MRIHDTADAIIDAVRRDYPDAARAVRLASEHVQGCKGMVSQFQAYALYALAAPYNRRGAGALEIGTAYGFSAAVMAMAAPQMHLTTLNPQAHEVAAARAALAALELYNVTVVQDVSWDYHATYTGPHLDLVFVDGDHANVRRDFVWWEWLKPGGLMLFHDYSPEGTWRACPPVYAALNERRAQVGRDFDVLISDEAGVGMAGWYKEAIDG